MNDGKVCISVCAEFAEEFVEKTRRAAQIADIVELRFDCLENIKNEDLWSGLYSIYHESETPYLFTYRPKAEGGMRELTDAQRSDFWYDAVDIDHFIPWVDMEIDMIDNSPICYFERLICSRHDFEKTPANLEEIYDQSAATFAGVIKIAVQADEITNCLPVWKLLQRAMSDGKEIIPIAMGEAGKWTRILGLAHGSPLTYASLEEGN
ncbi:MAG: type I 3-dehydroquinate dehydratase [Pyrinomonadaceae bacterium]